MILWVTGRRGIGKTTLARDLQGKIGAVLLDADEMRVSISKDLGFEMKDRIENNLRIARLAKVLHEQGHDVVVATICPTKELRKQVYYVCKCRFINL